jgi:ABC-type phosphate transport system substrate-binding protein
MRTSIVGAAFLLVGAGAATVAAVDTTGNNLALNGSDTLYDVTQSVLTSCGTQFSDFAGTGTTYNGGGSGVGEANMQTQIQELAPMSRALKSGVYCAPSATLAPAASAGLTEGLLVGIDGVAIVANKTNTCSGTTLNNVGALPSAPMTVTDTGLVGGPAPSSCPGCVGSTYAIADSFDALKVLYFGLTHDNSYNCASPVRKTLIRQWKNFFSLDCAAGDGTCGGGITHAWRRSDLSGTTDAFYNILGAGALPGGKAIGTLSTVPGPSQKSNPFCNGLDAQTPGTTGFPVSFGGATDFSDLDPIRTNCVNSTADSDALNHVIPGTGDGVCEITKTPAGTLNSKGDLGVVLPIFVPDAKFVNPSDYFPQTACSSACTLVAVFKGSKIPDNYKCPQSGLGPVLGGCYMPYAGSASSADPRCVTVDPTTRCFDVGTKKIDGRAYNLVTVVARSQIPVAAQGGSTYTYQFAPDAQVDVNRLMTSSFYRIHSIDSGANNVPDSTVGQTGYCNENDDTSQIGCLVDSDPCSVGYAGRLAARYFPGNGTPPNTSIADNLKALSVLSVPPFTPSGVSSDPDLALKNLLQPLGTTPLYPLSRRLYVATMFGFGNLKGGEKELAACYGNNTIVNAAMANRFVAVPGGVQCLDYPEEGTSSGSPAPNIQGSGNIALPGCALGLTGQNACTASAPSITN